MPLLCWCECLHHTLHCQRWSQRAGQCVDSGAAEQRCVLKEGHQLNRAWWISLVLCSFWVSFRCPALFRDHLLCFSVTAQPGSQRSLRPRFFDLLPHWVMGDGVTLETLPHGEGLPTACVGASEGTQLLVEGADVTLQVESCGVRPITAVSWTLKDHPHVRVNLLMLVQEPRVSELLVALVAPDCLSVLFLPVLQVLSPGLSCEAAAFFTAGITSVHLLMSLQLAGEGETHLTSFISALILRLLRVLLTHVGLQLLVFLELQTTALMFTDILQLLVLLGVCPDHVSGPVWVGGEGFRTSVLGTFERPLPAVCEIVSG